MEQDYQNKPKEKYQKECLNSFCGFFIKNFRFSYLLIVSIFLVGIMGFIILPRESDPEVQIPYAVVTTVYPGASPADVEQLITDELEKEIENLENLKIITSSSGEGISSISVQFEQEVDMKEATRNLRDAVDTAESKLPSEANDPMVTEIRANDFPLITFSLFGEYNNEQLQDYADLIQDELESINGVSKAPIIGELTKEFQIIIDQQKIQGYGLDISTVVGVISATNIDMPLGNIEIDDYQYNLRTKGRFENLEPLKEMVIAYYQEKPIYLRDIAEIKESFKEKSTMSRLADNGNPPLNTISLQIYKKTGGNILKIVDNAKKKIEELKDNQRIPENLNIKVTNDNSVYIRKDLNTLGRSALQTILLIILIIFIAMGWKESSLAVFVIPLTFLASFGFMRMIGFTLNSMTTFSLVLSLGLLVDTAIVIMEGIFDAMEHKRMNAQQASLYSLGTFKWALISGTMTTISAFAPLLLVSGIMGDYLKYIPITVSFTLGSSLFISLTILPTLASRILRKKKNRHYKAQEKKEKTRLQKIIDPEIPLLEKILVPVKNKYERILNKILPNKKLRRRLITIFIFLFIFSASLPVIGLMKVEMFPTIDFDYFFINIEAPTGMTLEETNEKVKNIEKYVTTIEDCANYVTTVGSSQGWGWDAGSSNSNFANITVNLVDEKIRSKKSYQLAQEARDYFKQNNQDDVKITIPPMAGGPPAGAPIELRITGDDLDTLNQIANDVKKILSEIKGVIDVETDIKTTTGQFVIRLDQQKLSYYNLNPASVSMTLRQIIYGVSATEITQNGKDIDIQVQYDEQEFKNIEDVKNLLISSPKGNIQLSSIADISFESNLSSIKHRDLDRVVSVKSSLEDGYNATKVTKELMNKLESYPLPENYYFDTGGEQEDIEQSFKDMFTSLFVAIILIAIILVLQFNSFKQPFIILFVLPLSLIGVIFGLTITRMNFSITAFIGVISLAGIVVNDAIVLISRINYNLREKKMDFITGIQEAARSRLQPIILTTLTTVIGLIPLALADAMWAGLSLSIIFGLTFATVLTLFVVPSLYFMLESKNYYSNYSNSKNQSTQQEQLKIDLNK